MTKGASKSSASSATRKKHARKAAGKDAPLTDAPNLPKEKKLKGKDKGRGKEPPRKKVYVPPVKPQPVQQDPIDSLGLAQRLPADLLVVWRGLSKKDVLTKVKALDELRVGWIDCVHILLNDDEGHRDAEGPARLEALMASLPVWMHHLPTLFLHPSRRLRILALTTHDELLRAAPLRAQMFLHLREVASAEQVECILGSWCMAMRDPERSVALVAQRSWDVHVAAEEGGRLLLDTAKTVGSLLTFVQRALLDPLALHAYLNPVQVPVDVSAPKTVRGRPVPTPPVAAQTRRTGTETPVRAKGESDEESETDRKARLRIGALGALQWILDVRSQNAGSKSFDVVLDILSDPRLWSSLCHAQTCPFADVESFGHAQPGVRSCAWALLQALLENWPDEVARLVPVLSVAVLRSAFAESSEQVRGVMWRPLLKFLKNLPRAWEIDATFDLDKANDSESDEADDGPGTEEETKVQPTSAPLANDRESPGFADFLQFLQLGCGGSPLQGYPAVIVVLSSIPSSILLHPDSDIPASSFFSSFWAALDGHALSALDRPAKSAAFLDALLECTTFAVRRVHNARVQVGNSVYREGAENELVRVQYTRVLEEYTSRRLRIEERMAGELIAKNLVRLSEIDTCLFDDAWGAFSPAMVALSNSASADPPNTQLLLPLLKAFLILFVKGSHPRSVVDELFSRIVGNVLEKSRDALLARTQNEDTYRILHVLLDLIDSFGDSLFTGVGQAETLDGTILEHAVKILNVSPSLLTAYLSRRNDTTVTIELWRSLLRSLPSQPIYTVLPRLLDAVERHALPDHLKPIQNEFDRSIGALFADAISPPNPDALPLLLRCLTRSEGYFVTDESFDRLFQQVVAAFGEDLLRILHGEDEDVAKLVVLAGIIDVCLETRPWLAFHDGIAFSLVPDIFALAFLLPRALSMPEIPVARKIWTSWLAGAPTGLKTQVGAGICARLQDAIFHTSILVSPLDILHATAEGGIANLVVGLDDLLPTSRLLDDLLSNLRLDPAIPSLAIIQPLIPPQSSFDVAEGPDCEADQQGLGVYARGVMVLLYSCTEDRDLALANLWALRHFLALAIYAEELLEVPSLPNPAFSRIVARDVLQDLIVKIQQLTAYLLTRAGEDDGWHVHAVTSLLSGRRSNLLGGLAAFTVDLIEHAQDEDDSLHCRILYTILQHVLRDTAREEADQWLLLARRLERGSLEISLAIVLCVAQFGSEPPHLDRYRNELAAEILGITASKANSDGLRLLRLLGAAAPDPDSDVVFLQQHRAVKFVKACQGWIASDADVDEDVESEITNVLFHLVPILQNVPGSHWDFTFDLIENNLENASFEDDETLTILWRTIALIQVIQDQVLYNKALRADWKQHETTILTLLRDIVASEPKSVPASTPRTVCREAALSIMQTLPPSLVDQTTLSKLGYRVDVAPAV
ncbi:hypothetical protein F5148DRAFT_1331820 [Russula earlei]|uniref:Uncharacterized protein n=1 Tax=Russula earlei TaxID=71964 RepID=A0ACC0TXZ5_9AGAM|nr:hypothetical protein F5148DRAFT_1331820 [Russula earlei]